VFWRGLTALIPMDPKVKIKCFIRLTAFLFERTPSENEFSLGVLSNKNGTLWGAKLRIGFSSGAAGIRTLVQTKHRRAFYMFSFRLSFREVERFKNGPLPNPYPLKFRFVVKEVHAASLRVC